MAEDVLLSLCNVGPALGAFSLARVDLATGHADLVDLRQVSQATSCSGLTGLCRLGDTIVAGLQSTPSKLLFLDRTLAMLEIRPLTLVRDIHSIVARGTDLLIASTGTDEVIAYDTRTGRERVFHAGADGRSDSLHLNALCLHQGQVIASMFGEIRPKAIRQGRIVNLDTGAVLLDGLRQPHTVMSNGAFLLVLESSTGRLMKFDGDRLIGEWVTYNGYVRGLCTLNGRLVAARSMRRTRSRSRDTVVQKPVSSDCDEHAALFVRDPDGSDRSIDLSALGSEIYDILPFADEPASANLPADLVRAAAFLHQGEPAAAAQLLAQADPADATGARLLAKARLALGDAAGAERALRALPPDGVAGVETKRLLGEALQQQQRYHAAAAIFQEACADRPEDANLWARQSNCLSQADRLEGATASMKRAVTAQPMAAALWNQYGALLAKAKKHNQALAAVQEALNLAPNSAIFLTHKGRLLRLVGRTEEALACLGWALENEPASPAAHFELGLVQQRMGDLAAAVAAYEAACRLRPQNEMFRNHVAAAQMRKKGQGSALDPLKGDP